MGPSIDPGGNRRLAWLLFLSCVLLYNLNHRYQGTADTAPNVYLPISLILHQDFYLDRFPSLPNADKKPPPYYLQPSHGRLISSFPVLPALLAVPVYLGPALWLKAKGIPYSSLVFYDTSVTCAKLAASMIAAGSAVFVFLTLAKCVSRSKAFPLEIGRAHV